MRPSGQWALGEAQPLSGSDAMVVSAVGSETPTVPLAGGAIPTDSSSRLAPQPLTMKRPDWYIRLHNPGNLLWWPGYLAWRWLKICWVGHPLRRVEFMDDCDEFWDAEEFGMKLDRNPELWDEMESGPFPSD